MTPEKAVGGRMTELKRLPGRGCRHHTAQRCLYGEHLNPGYHDEWRCRVITHWETAFDDFLARAENFGVHQDAVPDLWNRKFERMARETLRCNDFSYAAGADVPSCAHVCDGLCRLLLPECEGRCRHFELETNEDEE